MELLHLKIEADITEDTILLNTSSLPIEIAKTQNITYNETSLDQLESE